MAYLTLDALVGKIDGSNGAACARLLADSRRLFESARGSSHNHQAWPGGYVDHVTEVMNVAVVFYEALNTKRPLSFTLSDALLMLFLHDLEKPWVRAVGGGWTKAERAIFRLNKIAEYKFVLTEDQSNALRYVEGEGNDYSNTKRVMGPLAAFCHLCDVTSARIWFDHPLVEGDCWGGRTRTV